MQGRRGGGHQEGRGGPPERGDTRVSLLKCNSTKTNGELLHFDLPLMRVTVSVCLSVPVQMVRFVPQR